MKRHKSKKRLFASNLLLSFIGQATIYIVLQIVIYPIISKQISQEAFGVFILSIGVLNVISNIIGSSLNNLRLLNYYDVKKDTVFNTIFYFTMLVIVLLFIISSIVNILIGFFQFETIVLYIILILFGLSRLYILSEYRINFKYINILLNNIALGIGYGIGLILFLFLNVHWAVIFIIGEILSLAYNFSRTRFFISGLTIHEPLNKNTKDFFQLLYSKIIPNLLSYADRFIILPFLGAQTLAIYYVASVFGKSISFIVSPVSHTLLSFSSEISQKTFRKKLTKGILGLLIIDITFFSVSAIAIPIFIKLFYSDYTNIPAYIYLLSMTFSIINSNSLILTPFVLRFVGIKAERNIQTIFGLLYISLGIPLTIYYGIIGLLIAIIIAAIIRLILVLIYLYSKKKEQIVKLE